MNDRDGNHRRGGGRLPALLAAALLLAGCARQGEGERAAFQPVSFPPPPQPARVQYLGAVSSPRDLPRQRSGFAEFILGEEPVRLPLVKPNNAQVRGSLLYVGDTVTNRIVIYDLATGGARLLPGDRGNGKIQEPNNFSFDEDGRLYVADRKRQAVLVYGPEGEFERALGNDQVEPVDVIVRGDELFVCDVAEHEIEVWNRADGKLLRKFGGQGSAAGQFFLPTWLAFDPEGNLFVTDTGNFRVQKLTPEGKPLEVVGSHGDRLGQFALPKGMDVDGKGRLYVADARFPNVQIFDAQGRLLLFFGGPGPDKGNIELPAGLAVQPWPADAPPMLKERLLPGFEPEFLVTVVNQRSGSFVNFFAVAKAE